jgi:hypothetical protein
VDKRYKDGCIYIGKTLDGKYRHGKGYLVCPNGDIYIGDFKNNLLSGKGFYFHNEGSNY